MTCKENIHQSFSKSLPEAHSGYKVKKVKNQEVFINWILLKSQKTSDYRFHPTLFLIHHQIRHDHCNEEKGGLCSLPMMPCIYYPIAL